MGKVLLGFVVCTIVFLNHSKASVIDSVLTGVADKSKLKLALSKLETKQQVLIFGHAVPMPKVVKQYPQYIPDIIDADETLRQDVFMKRQIERESLAYKESMNGIRCKNESSKPNR